MTFIPTRRKVKAVYIYASAMFGWWDEIFVQFRDAGDLELNLEGNEYRRPTASSLERLKRVIRDRCVVEPDFNTHNGLSMLATLREYHALPPMLFGYMFELVRPIYHNGIFNHNETRLVTVDAPSQAQAHELVDLKPAGQYPVYGDLAVSWGDEHIRYITPLGAVGYDLVKTYNQE